MKPIILANPCCARCESKLHLNIASKNGSKMHTGITRTCLPRDLANAVGKVKFNTVPTLMIFGS